ncbi:sigma-70 family RNA polymerase sigma factor [Dactylosporangium fulvum]|uniref:Sigma-70 family RNA polymerase sigma factor n=1 Tax=Dactylosporangium fulvum TaxID=53359 RepID=A0ABY5VVR7_9ACTN|nr:sigma-70 family RNA polymerase sigma factor [Dactylosporangium fulvum]UWP80911.1 sigma-70 family RNA polymerase sigma factor [Dactylosporangium fulvum]
MTGAPDGGLGGGTDPATEALLAAKQGDERAAAAFVRSTQPEVWRFVAALVGVAHADDVTQDTYLRAFRSLPDFAGRSTARTWVLAIARRACADHVRAAVRSRRLKARVVAEPERFADSDHAGLHATGDLVAALPAERRVAFVLTQVLGLSYAEAAEIEDVPVGTIRSRVARARADLVAAIAAARAG